MERTSADSATNQTNLHGLNLSVRPAEIQVVHHRLTTVVVEAHVDVRETELYEPLGRLVVGSLRFSGRSWPLDDRSRAFSLGH
jgi:hypothetical protein